ncbi:MAG: aspartate--tRNA(Asn) ligase [Candidatus Dojkabacteria bacterium]|nr:MAG: aspartate--tRNA(Asn) ligase [Candidatus Dojkabacteria bacterium]
MKERTHVSSLREKIGSEVTIKGWAHAVRKQGSLAFIMVRDISGIVQIVVTKEAPEALELSKDLHLEDVISVTGTVKEAKQVEAGVEILVTSLEVLTHAAPELPIQVVEKSSSEAEQQARMDWRFIDLRKPERALAFKTWTIMENAFVRYCTEQGYINIHSPKLMGSASESGSEVFEVKYFDRKAYLAQSPQFYKQMAMTAGFEKVFEIGPVFRAEPSFTTRHATEFTGYDIEISFIDSHYDVMAEEERFIVAMMTDVKEKLGEEIKKQLGVEVVVPTMPFPKVTMKEAKEILGQMGVESEKPGDLSPEEERKLCEYIEKEHGHQFVFVTEYPITVRPFYHMRLEEDKTLTKSFDLLFKGVEITTGAQREHRYDILVEQAKDKGMDVPSLQYYLDFFKYGAPPHGGLGMGPSRMLMKLLNLESVRDAMFLYRGVKRISP